MTTNLNIAQRLKELRRQHGYTQKQVVTATGITRASYGAYEENRATPPLSFLLQLSKFYGLHSLDQLLGLTIENKKTKDELLTAYYMADPDKRKIVDFILNLKC